MRALALICVAALSAGGVAAQEKAPAIRFPVVKLQLPEPKPVAVPKLTAEVWYVIDSDVPILVLASPQGLVSVVKDAGPLRIRGKFIDGAGKTETREYKGKHVYTIEAAGVGAVELLVIPPGITDEKDVIRRAIEVDNGAGPRPPPSPDPPTPEPSPAPIPLAGLRVLIVFEEMQKHLLPAGQKAIISGAPMRDYLDSRCALGSDGKTREYRIWDKDILLGGAPKHWRDAMQRTRGQVPWIVVSNGKNGFEGPLPATVEETKALINKFAE